MSLRLSILAASVVLGLVLIGSAVALVFSSGGTMATPKILSVSTLGSDGNRCTKAEPCLSLDRAYDVAASGDTVEIESGTYGDQLITGEKKAPAVVLKPALGATVTVGKLGIDADQLEVRNVATTGDLAVGGQSDFATIQNVHVHSRLYIAGARDLKMIGGDVGPYVDAPSWITHENGVVPQRVLIQGVHFHDFTVSDPGIHTECLVVIAGEGLTLRGNRWTGCAVFNLSLGFCCESPRPPTNVVIENNFFGRSISDAGTTIHFNSNLPAANITIRNNSAEGGFALDQGQATFANVRVLANIVPFTGCGRASWSYNVMTGGKCPGLKNKVVRATGFVNPSAGDFHLTATASARNIAPKKGFAKKGFAAVDIDGQKRPLGKGAEAGADERP
jgi:hypothetical protein